jgi:exo-1,4-beta-D-glucosaminidase
MPRSRKFSARILGSAVILLVLPIFGARAAEEQPARTYLHKNWQIQSSCEVKVAGEQVSSVGFETKGWHQTDIPATVVGALVMDKTYPDPNYGTDLKSFPGMNYSTETFFANQEMPEGSPFRCSWWYRTEFTLPEGETKKTKWLNFLGINYRANIWINGHKVEDANDVAGTYRSFEFNVSKFLQPGKTNALAVEVFAPGKDDLEITWVDWNPTPPDKSMGLWKEVFLRSSGDVAVRNPFVGSKLDAEYKTAELTINGEVRNVSSEPVKGMLLAEVDGIKLRQPVELSDGNAQSVHCKADIRDR